jgi:hypothetical protein
MEGPETRRKQGDSLVALSSVWGLPMTSDMSERNEHTGKADRETIRARADLRYLARTSPPIPDALMQEAHRLIEADRENPKDPVPPQGQTGHQIRTRRPPRATPRTST